MRTLLHDAPVALLAALAVLATTACEQVPTAPASAGSEIGVSANIPVSTPQQVNLEFDKTLDEALSEEKGTLVWTGTVHGDLEGDLTSVLLGARETGAILQVDFQWTIEDGGASLVFETSGILNTNTGAVVMNGSVVTDDLTGYGLEGARVFEEGQAQDPDGVRFKGTFTIMKMTAG